MISHFRDMMLSTQSSPLFSVIMTKKNPQQRNYRCFIKMSKAECAQKLFQPVLKQINTNIITNSFGGLLFMCTLVNNISSMLFVDCLEDWVEIDKPSSCACDRHQTHHLRIVNRAESLFLSPFCHRFFDP